MTKPLYIKSFVRITQKGFIHNEHTLPVTPSKDLKQYAKDIYGYLQPGYPKFYKMDLMSKFGFLATELLLKGEKVDENTSLIFANQSASLHTDRQYEESIRDNEHFQPSPSVFVYTLPNIVMGEVAIRHQLKGENMFFVLNTFSAETYFDSVSLQYELNKAKSFIISWIEVEENDFNVFFALVTEHKQAKNINFNIDNLNTLNSIS